MAIADCLRSTPDPITALRRYEALRIPRAVGFVRASLRLGRVAQSENAVVCRLRDAFMSIVPSSVSRRQLVRTLR